MISEITSELKSFSKRRILLTLLELSILIAIPVALAALYFWTSRSFQELLVLNHTDPNFHMFWTASFVHEHRPDHSHLYNNIAVYLLLIVPTWILYHLKIERKRFWLYLASILTIGPVVINGASYLLLHEIAGNQITRDRGFSGIVGAIDGLLIGTIINSVAQEQEEKVGIFSVTMFCSFLMLGLGVATRRPLALLIGVLILVGIFVGIQLGYIAPIDEWLEWAKTQPGTAAILVIAAFASALVLAGSLPQNLNTGSGGSINIVSHGAGIIFGLLLEYQRTVRDYPPLKDVFSGRLS